MDAARARITPVVAALRPAGNVLEIACGTGLWTSALAGVASTVTAIDAAPEAVDIARGRVKDLGGSGPGVEKPAWNVLTLFGRTPFGPGRCRLRLG